MLPFLLACALAAPGDFDRGNALLAAGDPKGAEAAFRGALTDAPEDPEVRAQLGLSLHEQGRRAEAVAVLEQTLAEHPGHPASTWYLGVTHHAADDWRACLPLLLRFRDGIDASHPVWVSAHWMIADAYSALLGSASLTQAELDLLVAAARVYSKASPDTAEGERMAGVAAYVTENRPPRSVPRWGVAADADGAAAISENTGAKRTLVVEKGRAAAFRAEAPEHTRWVECAGELGCRFLLPDGWHAKQVEGQTHAVFLTLEPIAPPENRFETGVSINRIARVRARTGQTAEDFALAFLASTAEKEGARLARIPDPTYQVYVAEGAVQRDPGQPDLRKHYLVFADNAQDLVYLAFFETPATEWDRTWPVARRILDLASFGIEGRMQASEGR